MTGGAVVTLADAPSARGGAWSEDDTIVFSPNQTPRHALAARVRRLEGAAEPLTSLAEGEVIQLWPQVLPGRQGGALHEQPASPAPTTTRTSSCKRCRSGARKVVQRGGVSRPVLCRADIWSTCTTGRSLRRRSISTGWR